MKKIAVLYALALVLLCLSCTVKAPRDFTRVGESPRLSGAADSITLPCNIAPLNFTIEEAGDDYVTVLADAAGHELVCGGREVQWSLDKWRGLLQASKGATLQVKVYVKRQGRWLLFAPLSWEVAREPIDGYFCYRAIPPSYVHYENMSIRQRNLTNFDEQVLYDTRLGKSRTANQCVNCHNFQMGSTRNMQLHVRGSNGGTIIVWRGKAQKVDFSAAGLLSSAVYPAWHPTLPLIAYSVNQTWQQFYKKDLQRVEVQDSYSHLILYDIEHSRVIQLPADSNLLQTFPAWSPDGGYLYYAAARIPFKGESRDNFLRQHYDSIRYDILRMKYNMATGGFSQPDTLFCASALGLSATLPRVSPDGRFLIFTVARYGTFHIWHRTSDLWMMDLTNGSVRPLVELNSPNVESYHSWSSNSRWLLFASRRDDGAYTRPYIAYLRSDGTFSRPFAVPQESPSFYARCLYSFNLPEFTLDAVPLSAHDLERVIHEPAVKAQ